MTLIDYIINFHASLMKDYLPIHYNHNKKTIGKSYLNPTLLENLVKQPITFPLRKLEWNSTWSHSADC